MAEPNYHEEMKLPAGSTCKDCKLYSRCRQLFNCDEFTTCDWWPRRFEPKEPQS